MEMLNGGGPTAILDGPIRVGLQRWVGFPKADGKVHIYVWTTTEPSQLTDERVQKDIRQALELLDEVRAADPGFTNLLADAGSSYEYLYDYGMGAATVATFDESGSFVRL